MKTARSILSLLLLSNAIWAAIKLAIFGKTETDYIIPFAIALGLSIFLEGTRLDPDKFDNQLNPQQ